MTGKANWLQRFLGVSKGRGQTKAEALYYQLLAISRQAEFYSRAGVADSFDGRFDMVCLITGLAMRRLGQLEGGAPLAQQLFDATFADMDLTLREMGLGDLGVGKRVRTMSEAFLGRLKAYDKALDETGEGDLQEALARNLFRSAAKADTLARQMAPLVRFLDQQLASCQLADFENAGGLAAKLSVSGHFAERQQG